jgi:hypothetical protein
MHAEERCSGSCLVDAAESSQRHDGDVLPFLPEGAVRIARAALFREREGLQRIRGEGAPGLLQELDFAQDGSACREGSFGRGARRRRESVRSRGMG